GNQAVEAPSLGSCLACAGARRERSGTGETNTGNRCKKQSHPDFSGWLDQLIKLSAYIMPPMPPPIGGAPAPAFSSSAASANTTSVVSSIDAMEAAFSSAMRDTLVGSITPAPIKFSYTSERAL